MKPKISVLLDTSFFIHLLNEGNSFFHIAEGYYRYFLQQEIILKISTIAVAEYCVGGEISELPLKNMQIVPFNLNRATRAGDYANFIYQTRASGGIVLPDRKIIPNDTKLFAQASVEPDIAFYLSSDRESLKVYRALQGTSPLHFTFLDLAIPHGEAFGILPL